MIEIVPETFEPQWIENYPIDTYHQDKTAISSSGLKMLDKSPRHFKKMWLDALPRKDTDALRFGRLAHEAILEPDKFKARYHVMPDFGDGRKKLAQQAKQAWFDELPFGAEYVTKDDYDTLMAMIESLFENQAAIDLIKGGIFEVTGYFRDPVTGIKCKTRPDILRHEFDYLPELKTSNNPGKALFAHDVLKYGYHIQVAFNMFAVEQITGRQILDACFIVIDKNPPYEAFVYEVDQNMLHVANDQVRFLLNRLKHCVDNNHFPGKQEHGPETLSMPL